MKAATLPGAAYACFFMLCLVCSSYACISGQCEYDESCYNSGNTINYVTGYDYEGGTITEKRTCKSGAWLKVNGVSCSASSQCYNNHCVNSYCCIANQCGYAGGCYNDKAAVSHIVGYDYEGGPIYETKVCKGSAGAWLKNTGVSCSASSQCYSNYCVNSFCCIANQCGYAGGCYNDKAAVSQIVGSDYEGGPIYETNVCKGSAGAWLKNNGVSCSASSQCYSNNCVNGYCCGAGSCGYNERCYSEGQSVDYLTGYDYEGGPLTEPRICHNTVWLKSNGVSCSAASQCYSNNCVNDYCCNSRECGYSHGCYADGTKISYLINYDYEGSPNYEDKNCKNGVWLKSNGVSCSGNSQCYSNFCTNSYCCNGGQCGYRGGCYNAGVTIDYITSEGYDYEGSYYAYYDKRSCAADGTWRVLEGGACTTNGNCRSNVCGGGCCCADTYLGSAYTCCNCHKVSPSGTTVSNYNTKFSGEYKIDNGQYILCPGCVADISDVKANTKQTYYIYCENGAIIGSGTRYITDSLVSWTYQEGEKKAITGNYYVPQQSVDRSRIFGPGATMQGAWISGTDKDYMSIYTFKSPSHYSVYVDLIHAYCEDPATFACPYVSGGICGNVQGWYNQKAMNILVPGPNVSLSHVSPASINSSAGATETLVWAISNTGVGKINVRISGDTSGGWPYSFTGYSEGSVITLDEGARFMVFMGVSIPSDASSGGAAGIVVSYDDVYGLGCVTEKVSRSCVAINLDGLPYVTTSVPTTTLAPIADLSVPDIRYAGSTIYYDLAN